MRLQSLSANGIPPIMNFAIDDLADTVVIAGRNGIGKTRLLDALVSFFKAPQGNQPIRVLVEATNDTEKQRWGKSVLDSADPEDLRRLEQTLRQSRRRSNWVSSVVQFESDRSIARITPYLFSWDVTDPWEEAIGWDQIFAGFQSRFQDTLHSIFRKVRSQREDIASKAEDLKRQGAQSMPLDWPDPLAPFKSAFAQLLSPKELIDADLQNQTLLYREGDHTLSIKSLSSGEREVVNIVFDFILRNPEDCIVLFDEPELHLHPELSYKLLQTLRNVALRNQFVFSTHSPDIITASLDQSVVFIGPPTDASHNQAIVVREDDETNQALRLLGQSVGIIALGRRLVLIEGTQSSIDKQVYGSIIGDRFPDLVPVPTGGKGLILSFERVVTQVLDKTVWV